MDFTLQEQVAAFRYGLIAPVVSRQTPMLPGELKRMLVQIADQTYTIPGSQKTRVSIRNLERWIANYRRGGWESLKPKPGPQSYGSGIPPAVLAVAVKLRMERPECSVEQIIYLLEQNGTVKPGEIARSTLSRHLRKAGASWQELLRKTTFKDYRRFEAVDVHLLWQSDFQHGLYLHDPVRPKEAATAALPHHINIGCLSSSSPCANRKASPAPDDPLRTLIIRLSITIRRTSAKSADSESLARIVTDEFPGSKIFFKTDKISLDKTI